MKKILFFASALAGLFLAGSCQREMIDPVVEGGVTYTITLPEAVQTKGNSGYNDYSLHYEVYKTIDDAVLPTAPLLFEKSVDFTGNTAIVSLDLLNDQDYTVLFWANKKGVTDTYFDLTDLRNVQLKTGSLNANDNDRDAFCGMDQIDNHDGSVSKTVKLTRPFAQVNIGTIVPTVAEIGYDVTPQESYVKISGVPVAYNVLQGKAVAGTSNVEFKQSAIPVDKKIGTDYTLVAMNYVLVPESNITVEYKIKTPNGDVNNIVSNVPVKKNYRTNIIGNLLTSNATYTVEIKPGFETPDENVEIWDGKTITRPTFNAETSTWTIDNGAELAWIAKAVNGTLPSTDDPSVKSQESFAKSYDFANETVKLTTDIDLGDREWTPIGHGKIYFQGTFDGQGHTVRNFRVSQRTNGEPQAALFGSVAGTVTFKDITIKNATVTYPEDGKDFYGAALIGTAYGNLTVNNVIVAECNISGNNKVAGILAHDGVVSSLDIDNCHVVDCTIESLDKADGGNVGGLIGIFHGVSKKDGVAAPYGEHYIKNSSVKNTVINAINSSNTGKRANSEFVGGIIGKANQFLYIVDCEISGNTFTQTFPNKAAEEAEYVSPYGQFVGGSRNDDGLGTVVVNGKEMIQEGLEKEENTYNVSTVASLQAAFERVSDGETIKLEEALEITTPAYGQNALNFNRAVNCTIDLNGKTISADTGNSVLRFNIAGSGATSDVTVKVKNGKIVAGSNTWCAVMASGIDGAKAVLNLENVTVEGSKAGDLAVKAWGNGVINAEGVTINATNGAGGFYALGGEIVLDDCTVNQTGLHSAPYLSVAFAVSTGGKMTVNSGNYSSEPTAADEGYGQGSSHGSWVGGVMNSGGTLIINGGTFANGNYGDDALATAARGCIFVDTGAALEINGGTFDALKDIIDYQNNLGDASKNPVVTIKGGTFNADPFDNHYVNEPDGYFATETDGVWTVTKTPEASVNGTSYSTLAEAAAAAKVGDVITATDDVTLTEELTLPAGVTFNGNGKQINGTIVAGGDLTFAGHTKVTSFSALYYDRTITIGEGACLEVTGTGRVSLAYGNTFDIIGDVTDAKTADMTDIQPSLIIPGGISITGGNNAVMSIKDAYVQIGSTTSKNNSANGIFTLNIENSIAEFTNQLTFSEPTSGKTPKFNLNIKNSVVTLGTKLIAAAPGCNIKVDNSTVNIATYFRNSGKFELVNRSVLTGSTIQFGENGGNDGETIVDNSKFTINATSPGHALDGKDAGSLTIKNGAEAIVDYYKAMTVSVDETSTFTGTEVQ